MNSDADQRQEGDEGKDRPARSSAPDLTGQHEVA